MMMMMTTSDTSHSHYSWGLNDIISLVYFVTCMLKDGMVIRKASSVHPCLALWHLWWVAMKLIHPNWSNFNILEGSFKFLPYAHLSKSMPLPLPTLFPLRPPHATWKGAQTEDRSIALMPWQGMSEESYSAKLAPWVLRESTSWGEGFFLLVRFNVKGTPNLSLWKTVPVQPSQLRTLKQRPTGYCK